MNKNNLTYRFLSAITAFTILVSVVLPMNLYAHNHHDRTKSDTDHSTEITHQVPGNFCDMHSSGGEEHPHNTDECELHFDCLCSIEEAPARTEVMFSGAKAKIILPSVDLPPEKNQQDTDTFRNTVLQRESAASPPIFLLISSFLN